MSSLTLKRVSLLLRGRGKLALRRLSDAAPVVVSSSVAKRTQQTDPGKHSLEQVGLYYKVDDSVRKTLFGLGGLPRSYAANLDTFAETCFMIREPAVSVIELLKKADYSKPVIRYLLFGEAGCGKSVSLAHILHYAHLNDFVLLHVPWVWNWMRNVRHEVAEAWNESKVAGAEEHAESGNLQTGEGSKMVDLPLVAAAWLKHFQLQNSQLLDKLKLECSKEYVWSGRERTPAGSTLLELVSHGINRVKFACATVDALLRELKLHANNDRCRVLAAIDGFNALVGEKTNLKRDDRSPVSPSDISLTTSFLAMVRNDWKNGAVVVTVDQLSGPHETLTSHYPIYLLGRKGFELLDPFISVQVSELSSKELDSMLCYYEDRMWIQRKGGRHELSFISNNNPYQLMNLCAPL